MSDVQQMDEGVHLIDLHFQGLPGVIGSYLIEDSGERTLVETGPTSSLETLLSALHDMDVDPDSISKLLVTHIHLDHAGASGTFMRRFPRAQLFVHEKGAAHMIDPSKLLASARRVYGDRMGPLWGDFEAVPSGRVTILTDGDVVVVGRRRLTALYTPGHACHHVALHDADRGAVFTGDVAAVRLQGIDFVRPPTPPPDIDLDLWSKSLNRLRDLKARVLYLTHFGPFTDVDRHLAEAHDRLYAWADVVEQAQHSGLDRAQIIDTFRLHGDGELLETTNDPSAVERYELATPYGMSVDGFLRYFKKRAQAGLHA